jgi:hypothetical protein
LPLLFILRQLYEILNRCVYTLDGICMKIFFAILIVASFIFMADSCTKEYSVETPVDSGTVIVPDTTYQPLESGSYWVYQDSASGTTDTLRATDSTLIINNKTYTVFHVSASGQTADEDFSITSHNYYSYGSFGNDLTNVELLYLNDTASVGYTWEVSAGTINGYPAQVQGEILDTGLTVTMGSNTFSRVILTQISIAYNVGSGFQTPYAIYDYYVAKGIGIIKIEEDFPTLGVTDASTLIAYSIQ